MSPARECWVDSNKESESRRDGINLRGLKRILWIVGHEEPVNNDLWSFMLPIRLFFTLLALASICCAESFDKPLVKKTIDLGLSQSNPKSHAKVTCYFYSGFMVKEVDLGEKGADRLSIVPTAKGTPLTCTRARSKSEKVIDHKEWSGYFKGAKNNLVFFDADDGVNGGVAFAIYDAKTATRIFEDSASGPLEFSTSPDQQLSLHYLRVLDAECAVPKEKASCWERIKQKIGPDDFPMPDCEKGYEENAQNLAKGRCDAQNPREPDCLSKELKLVREQWSDASSIISYPVIVTLGINPIIKPVAGAVKCWPAD